MGKHIDREIQTVEVMIGMYCRGHRHQAEGTTCKECSELAEYATRRLKHCRYGERKPTCRKCQIHCYRKDMRQRISIVMRWSGKRMMLRHPIAALRHLFG